MDEHSQYVAPTLTVDAAIFQLGHDGLEVLLSCRQNEPFAGLWALPGGYNAAGYTTAEALQQVIQDKAGVDIASNVPYVEQLYTFDTVARDPRGHAVSVTYMGCGREIPVQKDVSKAAFFKVSQLPKLAFDHCDIVNYAHERLCAKLGYTNAVFGLLHKRFTLTQLQSAYEAVFERKLDKRNFRKKFLSLNLIHETDETWRQGAHRPARLYEFNQKSLQSLSRSFE